MMKYRIICLFVTLAASISLATAQTSQARSSSAKSSKDPLRTATQPLTPKSTMPPQRKSSTTVVPRGSKSTQKENAELSHLERDKIKAGGSEKGSSNGSKGAAKGTALPESSRGGSAINFKYQKPAGGLKATTPGANSKSSSTPRVTKKN
jgi:hypothetical protein